MTTSARFQGRVFAVTGAARGLGYAIAARAVAEGGRAALIDLDEAVAARAAELGGNALSLRFDVTDPGAWREAVCRIRDWGGGIHALACCAGILGRQSDVVDEPLDDWERVLRINLTGVFVSNQAVLPVMIEQGYGRIVNLASIAGKEGNPGQAAYSASKGGVIALTKSLAKEVATRGITVNCVAPTVIEGPFSEAMTEESRRAILQKIPMRRFGRPDEVAALVTWICSDECSFNTGVCFDLSGGRATF